MLQLTPMTFGNNPFAVLTLIAAPAVFTNASSILALGTANRLARNIDHTRDLGNLIANEELSIEERRMRAEHIRDMEVRTNLLVRAMQAFYTSVGAFAAASLISLLGAGLTYTDYRYAVQFTIFVALAAGCVGFGGLVTGGVMLVRETRMAVVCLREEAEFMLRSLSEKE
jgi:hypothetical protein